jgi:hypothetical protein
VDSWKHAAMTMGVSLDIHNVLKTALAAFLLVLTFNVLGRRLFARFSPDKLSRSFVISVTLLAMLLPIGWRLILLPWRPEPEPKVHDEYNHLLVADTLAAGRLANPPHVLWRHFDTFYVLQRPAYASIYPIGQGGILAVGKLVAGDPWLGVLLASALMCGAIVWVLFETLSPWWAALGALPIAVSYTLSWIDSYWGGTWCAFGGAILFAGLLRLHKSPSKRMAIVAALGWSITWLTRPFESILLFVVLWGSVAVLVIRSKRNFKPWIAPVLALAITMGCAGTVTLLHNRAVTGSFTALPYVLSQEVDGVPQGFTWQPIVPPPTLRFPEMKEMYLWQLHHRQSPLGARASLTAQRIWEVFVTPWFSLPFLLGLFAIRDRIVLVAWAILACAGAISLMYGFFFAHYIAAYACVFAFLIVRGLKVLYDWNVGERPIGHWAVFFLILGGILYEPLTIMPARAITDRAPIAPVVSRKYISQELLKVGKAHVAFVRYGRHHEMNDEWVYNAANIDAAPIVWCRWMGESNDAEVKAYYPDRRYWIVDVDYKGQVARVSSYPAVRNESGRNAS